MGRILVGRIFAVVGAMLAASVLWICTACQNTAAWVVSGKDRAAECVEVFSRQVSQGNLEAASAFLMGFPQLDIPEGSETEMQLWEAFLDSLECTPEGAVFPTSTGLAQNVQLHYLDLSAAVDAMQKQTQTLLTERIEAAEDMADVYTQEHNYRPDFLAQLLKDAAMDAIAEAPHMEQTLPLNLRLINGQWSITPDTPLLAALSGGVFR